MVDIYDPNRGYVPTGPPGERVYDPVRGMVPVTPQQNYIEWLLSQLNPQNIQRRSWLDVISGKATRDALTAGTGDPIIPPPMATGEQGYVAPVPPRGSLIDPITATPPLGAPGTSGSALAGPPAPASAFGPTGAGGVLPSLDRDRALPPLQSPNSMTPTPPAMLGGNNYAAGPMSSGPAFPPPARDSWATDVGGRPAGATGPAGLGGLAGPTRINAETAAKLYADESGMAIRQGFQDAGIDPFTNRYAQAAIRRYAPVLPQLMEFFALASGHDLQDTAAMATWVPEFIQKFMSGEIDPQKLVQRAITMASSNAPGANILKEYLLGTGPEGVLKLQGDVSGYGPRVEGARQRVLREQIARKEMEQLRNPVTDQEDAWLAIMQGAR